MPEPTITVKVTKELSEVERANDILRELWTQRALPEDFELPVTICLEEVLSNVIRHGRFAGAEQDIQVCCRLFDGGIEVEVIDNAAAFNPLSLPPPKLDLPLEELKAGGLGVFMVRKMMEDVAYEYRDGRNHLRYRKHWDRPPFGEPV